MLKFHFYSLISAGGCRKKALLGDVHSSQNTRKTRNSMPMEREMDGHGICS